MQQNVFQGEGEGEEADPINQALCEVETLIAKLDDIIVRAVRARTVVQAELERRQGIEQTTCMQCGRPSRSRLCYYCSN